jgi:hypothetical protein
LENVFLFFMMLAFFGFIGIVVYKYRAEIHRWLHDPKYGTAWHPSRETYLKRRIEDSEAELQWLAEKTPENKPES